MAERIKVGDPIPSVKLKLLTDNGMDEVDTAELTKGKKVVMFAVPGAFTPTCSAKHLPGFIQHTDKFAAKGVDRIICLSVNDPFVMKAWGEQSGVNERVLMLPDGNAEFTKAMGLDLDASGFGLGTRSQRFAMLIEDGTVKDLQVDEGGAFEVSSAEYMLNRV